MTANPNSEIRNYPKDGQIITLCSAKGGVGRTVISSNLSVALASRGISTCLIDASFQFGDIHLALDLQPVFTIKDIIEQIETIDSSGILHYLNRHDSGLRVLAAPPRPEYADLVTIEHLDNIVNILRNKFDYIIVDTLSGLSDHALYFIEKSDHILLVTDLEMATLKNTKMMLDILTTLELNQNVKILVNRSTMQSVISAADVPQTLNKNDVLFIPNDFEVVSKSLNIGLPFVIKNRRAEISKTILGIAEEFLNIYKSQAYEPKKPSLTQNIFNKLKFKRREPSESS
jgi:pilus assembly protein CpaE